MQMLQDCAKEACTAFEADLQACIAGIFDRFPVLSGFSVAERLVAPRTDDSDLREWELYIADIAVGPEISHELSGEVQGGISQALSELCHDRPEGAHLLIDRTFARAWH